MRVRLRSVAARAGALIVLAVSAAACDGPGNTGSYSVDPNLVRAVPWLNGVLPALDKSGVEPVAVIPDVAQYPPIALGLPDPGSQRTDCAAADGYQFSTGWFDDFEPLEKTDPLAPGVAKGWASYDDLSKYAFHTPGDATWYTTLNPAVLHTAWGLPAEKKPGPACGGVANDWVLHFRGGLFRKWGGGISHAFTDPDGWYRPSDRLEDCMFEKGLCPPPLAKGATVDTAGLPTKTAKGDDFLQSHDFFDVSSYDGIAFWARRGPEGFDRALVILTDKFTSSRLARENQTFCKRVRECHTRCLSGSPCAPEDPTVPPTVDTVYRCYDPAQGPLPKNIAIATQMDQMYPRCGRSACTSPGTYQDLDFDEKECRPYTYPNDGESGEFCWNPGDPPPADRDERCQDGWQTSIQLTGDWTFHALPWSAFAQAQFGKRAPYLDLKSLDTLAFGAVMGWSDMYFDNVTLYRKK